MTEEALLPPPPVLPPPSSSLLQTTLNITNILMGVSILSLPFAFHLAGFLPSLVLLALGALVTASSALILARIQRASLSATGVALLTFGDIGEAAFGHRGRFFIQFIFCWYDLYFILLFDH
jgi:vesicular inhibitory amino acid transporter